LNGHQFFIGITGNIPSYLNFSLTDGSTETETRTGELGPSRAPKCSSPSGILHGFRTSSLLHLALDGVRHGFGFFKTTSSCRPCQVGGSHTARLQSVSVFNLRTAQLEGLANGLSYLHEIPVVHGDIRGVSTLPLTAPYINLTLFDLQTNVLVSSDGEPRISDFGLSYHIGNLMPSTTPHGSLRWKAPERHMPAMFGLSSEEAQGIAGDVWSFGMTVLVNCSH
jgi:serine/threonine protein kinase